jgi:hypothetical protein
MYDGDKIRSLESIAESLKSIAKDLKRISSPVHIINDNNIECIGKFIKKDKD